MKVARFLFQWMIALTAVWLSQTVDFAPRLVQLQRVETHFSEFVAFRLLLALAVSSGFAWLFGRAQRRIRFMAGVVLFGFGLFCLLLRLDDLLTG